MIRPRSDTRRVRHGKVFGGHNGHTWASPRGRGWGTGWYLKTVNNRVQRRYWSRYARVHLENIDPDREMKIHSLGISVAASNCNWKGT